MNYQEFHKELAKWKREGIINEEQYNTLDTRYKPKQYKIPRIHHTASPQKMLSFFAIAIIILGILSWVAQKSAVLNNFVVFASLIFFVVVGMFLGDYVAGRPIRVLRYTGKLIILLACALLTFTVFYIDIKTYNIMKFKLFGTNWATFMLVSTIILIPIAYKMREKVVLAYSIILFLIWFISEGKIHTGGYISSWLYMTFATRMFVLSWIFMGLGYIHKYKVLKRFDPSEGFYNLHKTYYISGLLVMLIPALIASWGGWLAKSMLPVRIEATIFVILALILSLGSIYIGLIKSSKLFLNFGIVFFVIEVYGKFYQVFHGRIAGLLFYLTSLVVLVALGSMVEYVLRHKEDLKEELLIKEK